MSEIARERLQTFLDPYFRGLVLDDPMRVRSAIAGHLSSRFEVGREAGFLLVDRALRSEGASHTILVRVHCDDRKQALWPIILRREIISLLGGNPNAYPRFTNRTDAINDLEMKEAIVRVFSNVGGSSRTFDHVAQALAEHFGINPARHARQLVTRAIDHGLIRISGPNVWPTQP